MGQNHGTDWTGTTAGAQQQKTIRRGRRSALANLGGCGCEIMLLIGYKTVIAALERTKVIQLKANQPRANSAAKKKKK